MYLLSFYNLWGVAIITHILMIKKNTYFSFKFSVKEFFDFVYLMDYPIIM